VIGKSTVIGRRRPRAGAMADNRMQTLREVYQNLSHTSTPDWPQHKDVDSGRADKAEARGHSRRRSRQTEESEALERDFAMAVFEIGLRQSSPKVHPFVGLLRKALRPSSRWARRHRAF